MSIEEKVEDLEKKFIEIQKRINLFDSFVIMAIDKFKVSDNLAIQSKNIFDDVIKIITTIKEETSKNIKDVEKSINNAGFKSILFQDDINKIAKKHNKKAS